MNIRIFCMIMALLLLMVFTACTPALPAEQTAQNDGVTTSKVTENSTTLTEESSTTTVTEAITTTATTSVVPTTTTTKLPSKKSTSISTTNTVPTTKATIPPDKSVEPEEPLTFSYGSEDYTVLKQYIAKHFPMEKNLDEFRIRTGDGTGYKNYEGFCISFIRWINGCATDSHYVFFFDTDGRFVEMDYRSFEYDASKVKPPRVATEEEIEAAKQAEAAKLPEGMVLWKYEISDSQYSIYQDRNYFQITTLYVSQMTYGLYLVETGEFYGKEPPHAALIETYTIPR